MKIDKKTRWMLTLLLSLTLYLAYNVTFVQHQGRYLFPVLVPAYNDIDQMLSMVRHRVLGDGLASRGDRLVVTAGTPLNQPGTTNLIKVMQL